MTPLRLLRAACLAAAFAAPLPANAQPALPTVPALDLDRYAGQWHEIARYPNSFERDCARDVTATYTRNADGTVQVVNACRKADGSVMRAEGLARMAVPPAKLEVRFAPAWLSWLPLVWADYWVIALDPDYQWAMVGEPGRDYLWILSRTPEMERSRFDALKARAEAMGYDLQSLVVSGPVR